MSLHVERLTGHPSGASPHVLRLRCFASVARIVPRTAPTQILDSQACVLCTAGCPVAEGLGYTSKC